MELMVLWISQSHTIKKCINNMPVSDKCCAEKIPGLEVWECQAVVVVMVEVKMICVTS
jgi:hypothetical protein